MCAAAAAQPSEAEDLWYTSITAEGTAFDRISEHRRTRDYFSDHELIKLPL